MNKTPTELEDDIQKLIFQAEVAYESNKMIIDFYIAEVRPKLNQLLNTRELRLLIIFNNFCFQESISILHTLFENKSEPQEISYASLFYKRSEDSYTKDIKKLSERYRNKLGRLRNNFFMHKNAKSAGDTSQLFINLVSKDLTDEVGEIITELKRINNVYNSENTNNYLIEMIEPTQFVIESVEKLISE